MINKVIYLILFITVITQSILGQPLKFSEEEQEVKCLVIDFNRIVFKEMNLSKAIKSYLFLGEPDSTDLKYGLEINLNKFFQDTKQEISNEDKIKVIASEFNSSLKLPLLYWQLGKASISSDTRFVDSFIVEDKEFEKIWLKVIKKMGLTEEMIDNLDTIKDRNMIEKLNNNFNSAISKKIKIGLYDNNIAYINDQMKINKEVFEGRNYFIVKTKLFNYKVTLKKDGWKLMYIERN